MIKMVFGQGAGPRNVNDTDVTGKCHSQPAKLQSVQQENVVHLHD